MEWTDWVDWKPETKTDIKIKIENDGYTFPHYDKKNNGHQTRLSKTWSTV